MNETRLPENRAYKVTLIVLLGLAAFTTAMKELNRLHGAVSSVHEFTRQWRGSDLITLNEKPESIQETTPTGDSCLNGTPSPANSSDSGSSDDIASIVDPGSEGIDCETIIAPEVGAKVDLIAGRQVNRSTRLLTRSKIAPARNLNEEIASVAPHRNWPSRFEYKTHDRRVTLEIPMVMISDIKANALENEVSPEFVMALMGKINRQQSHGKAETRRRELMIKRAERNTGARRAS